MPILPLEPFVSPESLFQDGSFLRGESERWWVLHTRPRAEKALARRLCKRDVSFFLPLFEKRWRIRGRTFKAYMPAFSSYVFLFGDAEARLRALETNLVSQVLHVEDQAELEFDLKRIHDLMISGATMTPENHLRPGTPVEVIDGPFMGMEGKVLSQHNKVRFFVEVRFLHQGVSVELENWMIRPLGGNRESQVAVACS